MKRLPMFQKIFALILAVILAIAVVGILIMRMLFQDWDREILEMTRSAAERSAARIQTEVTGVETTLRQTAVFVQSMDYMSYVQSEYEAKRQVFRQLTLMTELNRNIDALFAVRGSGEGMIRKYGQNLRTEERIAITAFLSGEDCLRTEEGWRTLRLAGQVFLLRTYRYGEFVAGALVRLSNYEALLQFVNESTVYSFTDGAGESCYATGDLQAAFANRAESSAAIPALGLTLRSVTDAGRNLRFSSATTLLIAAMLALGSLSALAMLRMVRREVKKPVDELVLLTEKIISGDYSSRISARADSEEFEKLNRAVNEMLDEICSLQMQRYENELALKSQELKLLRSQIKPHYYLNALNTVSNMTYQNRNEEIRGYLKNLSKHLRYSFSVRDIRIPLYRELDMVENYIQMQQLRFPDSVSYVCRTDEGLAETPILHMMLLTVVENSFKYGLTLYEPLRLTVSCRRMETGGGAVCRIELADNGPGFSEEALARFRSGGEPPEDGGQGTGLLNVRRTLELLFGGGELMELGNREGGGAVTVFHIPIREKGEEEHDKAFDRG